MISESKKMAECYRSICWFFEMIDLPRARKYIHTSLMAANSKRQWKGHTPSDLIYFYEDFTKLYNTTTHLAASGCKRQAAIIDADVNLDDCCNISLYCSSHNKTESRLYVPVYLSAKEFCNPYKAIKKAVRFIEKTDKEDDLFNFIIKHALSNDSFIESCVDWDVLKMNVMLQKILEATHLLYVRACTNDDRWLFRNANKEKQEDNLATNAENDKT
ncbi:MAG TPA: hypothetical protein VFW07_25165 [Parafilimonas sp.]|nr:hypothetical protein [Parafilimonas sp.]